MSLIAKSCNSTSKLEMLVLHIVVLSAFATVVKINEVRIANSMGAATLKEKNTVPQNNKIFKHLWWNRRDTEVSENLKISWLLLKWNERS